MKKEISKSIHSSGRAESTFQPDDFLYRHARIDLYPENMVVFVTSNSLIVSLVREPYYSNDYHWIIKLFDLRIWFCPWTIRCRSQSTICLRRRRSVLKTLRTTLKEGTKWQSIERLSIWEKIVDSERFSMWDSFLLASLFNYLILGSSKAIAQ